MHSRRPHFLPAEQSGSPGRPWGVGSREARRAQQGAGPSPEVQAGHGGWAAGLHHAQQGGIACTAGDIACTAARQSHLRSRKSMEGDTMEMLDSRGHVPRDMLCGGRRMHIVMFLYAYKW